MIAPCVCRILFYEKETKETTGIQTRPQARILVFCLFCLYLQK